MNNSTAPTGAEGPDQQVTILTNLSLMLSVLWLGGLLSIPGLILGALAGHMAQRARQSLVMPFVAVAVALTGLIGALFFWRWVL